MIRAEQQENRDAHAALFALIGLLTGGVATYVMLLKMGGMDWPKWLRFTSIIIGATAGSYILAKLSDLLVKLILLTIVVFVVLGIGTAIWRAV